MFAVNAVDAQSGCAQSPEDGSLRPPRTQSVESYNNALKLSPSYPLIVITDDIIVNSWVRFLGDTDVGLF